MTVVRGVSSSTIACCLKWFPPADLDPSGSVEIVVLVNLDDCEGRTPIRVGPPLLARRSHDSARQMKPICALGAATTTGVRCARSVLEVVARIGSSAFVYRSSARDGDIAELRRSVSPGDDSTGVVAGVSPDAWRDSVPIPLGRCGETRASCPGGA